MKTFVNNAINEISSDESINKHSLIKVLVEAVSNSLRMGNGISHAYNTLKNGLVDINEHLKNDKLSVIIKQFDKFEETDDNLMRKIYDEPGLKQKLTSIKESGAYADPIIMHNVDLLENSLLEQGLPEFKCCKAFVNSFKKHSYHVTIAEAVKQTENYISNNMERLLVLDAIYEMTRSSYKMYKDQIEKLTKMFLNEAYSSEAIKIKLNSNLPVLNTLVKNLAIYESSKEDKFMLGGGNNNCIISSTIVPSTKLNESSILLYMDDKFLSLSNKTDKDKVGIILSEEKKSTITQIEADYVKENHSDFYKVCDAFYKLNFVINEDGKSITSRSIRNLLLEFKIEEEGNLNIYLNKSKLEDPNSINISELLVMEKAEIKDKVSSILKGTSSIFNFEFIKKLKNTKTNKETFIIEANGDYHICEKMNKVERDWKKGINEYKLYNYVIENFNYDISPIFKVKIDESISKIKAIEDQKKNINSDISILEESVQKLNDNINSGEIDDMYIGKLENLKEQIENKIVSLKEAYVDFDLKKKELVH